MNEEPVESPSIGRYILLGLVFVLLFVGIAYLVYRFSGRGGTPTPSPTPTPIVQNGGSTAPGIRYPTILPAPQSQPINPKSNIYRDAPFPNRTQVVNRNNSTIAQDGRGNLLFDNLTHDENFQLQMARINADARLKQQQDENATTLALQKERDATQLALARLQADQQKEQLAKQAEAQKAAQEHQQAMAKQQQQNQPSQREQYQYQLALERIKGQNQLAQQQVQSASQLKLAQSQQLGQIIQQDQQNTAALAQMTLQQKQQLANLAYSQAVRSGDQQHAIRAMQLQSDLQRLDRAQQYRQTVGLTTLQAQIQENLLILSRQLNSPFYY